MARFALITIILLSCGSFIFAQDTTEDPPWDVAPWPLEDHRPQPEYPVIMQYAGTAGEVEAKVWINPAGEIDSVSILKSKPKTLGVEDSVLSALQQWRFLPAQRNGKEIVSSQILLFRFIVYHEMPDTLRYPDDSLTLNYYLRVEAMVDSLNSISDSTVIERITRRNDRIEYIPPPIVAMLPNIILENGGK